MRHAGRRLPPRLGARGDRRRGDRIHRGRRRRGGAGGRPRPVAESPRLPAGFEERFDAARMARDYLEVYRQVVDGEPRDFRTDVAIPGQFRGSIDSNTFRFAACSARVELAVASERWLYNSNSGARASRQVPFKSAAHDNGAAPHPGRLRRRRRTDPRAQARRHVRRLRPLRRDQARRPRRGRAVPRRDAVPLLPGAGAGRRRPFFLGSTVRDENDQLSVALTNPDLLRDGRVEAPARHAAPGGEEVPLAGRVLPAIAGRRTTGWSRSPRRFASTSRPTSRTSSRSAG